MSDHVDIDKLPLEIDGIPVRETIREIFRNPENGTPDNISKAGCLALALKSNEYIRLTELGNELVVVAGTGAVIWNTWRKYFPDDPKANPIRNHVDFSDYEFRSGLKWFSYFCFGNGANFSNAKFPYGANFEKSIFGEMANFRGTNFGGTNFGGTNFGGTNFGGTNFDHAIFGGYADFRGAVFGDHCRFAYAKWGVGSKFDGARWGSRAYFRHARWEAYASFTGTHWEAEQDFSFTQWDSNTSFENSHWKGKVTFWGAQWGVGCDFRFAYFEGFANFRGANWNELQRGVLSKGLDQIETAKLEHWKEIKHWAENHVIAPDTFQHIDFSGATFLGTVDFSNRKFNRQTKFGILPDEFKRRIPHRDLNGNVVFNDKQQVLFDIEKDQHRYTTFGEAPKFHGCELHQDTSFEGAEFPKPTGSEESARAYRTLKLAFNKQQAVREEQRFFRLELAEETAGYRNKAGQALREFKFLLGVREGFIWFLYKTYSGLSDYGFSVARPLLVLVAVWLLFAQIYGGYASGQTACVAWQSGCALQADWLSFSLQQALPLPGFDKLEHTITGVAVGWLFLHKTLSLAALFLIGLALRNLFKLK